MNCLQEITELNIEKVAELQELELELNGIIGKLVNIFKIESNKRLIEIKDKFEEGSFDQIAISAHALSSTCHNIAATNLGHHLKDLENKCKITHPEKRSISSMISKVEIALIELNLSLDEKLHEKY